MIFLAGFRDKYWSRALSVLGAYSSLDAIINGDCVFADNAERYFAISLVFTFLFVSLMLTFFAVPLLLSIVFGTISLIFAESVDASC